MKNDDAKLNRIRSSIILHDGLKKYVKEEEVKRIRDTLYNLLDDINNPSELHIHTAIAEGLVRELRGRIATLGDTPYIYNEETGTWDDADGVFDALTEAMYVSSGPSRNEVKAKIIIWTKKERADFDNIRKGFIGFKNGAWDIKEWKFVGHDKAHCLLTCIPIDFIDGAACPAISTFLSQIVYSGDDMKIWKSTRERNVRSRK